MDAGTTAGFDSRAVFPPSSTRSRMTYAGTLLPYASRSTRLLGQFVDGIVGAAPFLVGLGLTAMSSSLGSLVIMVGLAWSAFYYLFADGLSGGQSFAKQWLGLKVVD